MSTKTIQNAPPYKFKEGGLDITKTLRTRSGLLAEVLRSDVKMPGGGDLCMVGLIFNDQGEGSPKVWTLSGHADHNSPAHDIANPIVTKTVYVNLLAAKNEPRKVGNLSVVGPYISEELAKEAALLNMTRDALLTGVPLNWEDVE